MRTFTTNGGLELPVIGFGTYKLNGNSGADSVAQAIANGYRLIDSAFNYENEGAVGEGVRRSGITREQVIVTSKLPGRRQRYESAIKAVEESVFRTGLGYIDLYLIHWPNPRVDKYVEAWQALIAAKDAGLVRHIGVCNFLPEHLTRIIDETGVVPEVNQIELNPYFPQLELADFNSSQGIITQAWSPLRRGELLEDPAITALAASHGVTPGQIVLAWEVARGVVPIPKASSTERQLENLGALDVELSEADVATISALGRPDGRLFESDPNVHEEF
ncbi:aldo/keto reductase [Changpingibacter yushuensis]|uniref:aldo/keto reductase n=1 Tax=Changpingibacter yushuensis TaxID=2758440 RepID=UPI0015F3ED2A|nr:aldo/keto reductase [Changpingibacter yushuensis]